MGKFLHGANDLGHPLRSIDTLVDGARHFGHHKVEIAASFGLLKPCGRSCG
jgi:hypothetical protein